ncbi:unnamed protein product [Arctogadus glacialis]
MLLYESEKTNILSTNCKYFFQVFVRHHPLLAVSRKSFSCSQREIPEKGPTSMTNYRGSNVSMPTHVWQLVVCASAAYGQVLR